MYDPRMRKLADVLIDHSIRLKEGETVYIEAFDVPDEMVEVLLGKIYEVGGVPMVALRSARVMRKLLLGADQRTLAQIGEVELAKMKRAQAYIGIRGSFNITENSDVPAEKMDLYMKHWSGPVHTDWRVPNTKWVVLRWPTASMAQQAQMSTEGFEDFYFNTCTLDYSKMSRAMDPLVELMERTDRVRIVGPGTDLGFSIKGIPVVKCDGERNIPDGEVYTAPVKGSVNGTISYNTKTLYQGKVFENVVLRFKDGRIVEATSSNTKDMNAILDTDEGARYVGEFAIGVNPFINKAMLDILFDEKIAGSIHFTPGNAYKEADNGNRSTVHWDLVLCQTPEWGGGEIYFDGRLVRKDGRFVIDELKGLNPESLV
ncbi:MAG TPA: aminopeptidase [Methanomassiliicoccales archaeon]|nr:aminopeptidase [Euryarchaeota archaeon]HOE53091.1 aminopeptidase [Methanomassiliicoccales archaeon]HQM66659.1 aminopeptidase [Methanomassiliicoccales archaeon]